MDKPRRFALSRVWLNPGRFRELLAELLLHVEFLFEELGTLTLDQRWAMLSRDLGRAREMLRRPDRYDDRGNDKGEEESQHVTPPSDPAAPAAEDSPADAPAPSGPARRPMRRAWPRRE